MDLLILQVRTNAVRPFARIAANAEVEVRGKNPGVSLFPWMVGTGVVGRASVVSARAPLSPASTTVTVTTIATVSDSIRKLLEIIERKLRHTCARDFRVFMAAFHELCRVRQQPDMILSASPISMFLDAGASSEETLALLALGLSRTIAIKIAGTIRGQGKAGAIRALTDVRYQRILARDLPSLCVDEVRKIASSAL